MRKRIFAFFILFMFIAFSYSEDKLYLPLKKREGLYFPRCNERGKINIYGDCFIIKNKNQYYIDFDKLDFVKGEKCAVSENEKMDMGKIVYKRGYIYFYRNKKLKWKRKYGLIKPAFFAFTKKSIFVLNVSGVYNLFSKDGDLLSWGKIPPEEKPLKLKAFKDHFVILTDRLLRFYSEEKKKFDIQIPLRKGKSDFLLDGKRVFVFGEKENEYCYIEKYEETFGIKIKLNSISIEEGSPFKASISSTNLKEGVIKVTIKDKSFNEIYSSSKEGISYEIYLPSLKSGEYMIKAIFDGEDLRGKKIRIERFKKFYVEKESKEKNDDKKK